MAWYQQWKPYVSVAKRRAKAERYATQLAKKSGRTLAPIAIEGRKIAKSFWGEAWCKSLEQHSDYSNRLPRGATYVRNGSVIDLQIAAGKVKALVSGSEIYTVTVTIEKLPKAAWSRIRSDCSQSIDSLIDLLQGRFDQGIMRRLSQRDGGLFPQPREIKMSCTCPDWAGVCKHVAATFYGVGARLDSAPELLFTLRGVDHLELIGQAVTSENLDRTLGAGQTSALAGSDLGELFGIELETGKPETATQPAKRKRVTAAKSAAATKSPAKPAVVRRSKIKPAETPLATAAKKKSVAKLRRDPPEAKVIPPAPRARKSQRKIKAAR
ncbi:MAG: hypothetical protein EXS05_16055 [Planctomycetaceae bacterium]|nr:hypothetical protein [Planctomycetaceae bacterium]